MKQSLSLTICLLLSSSPFLRGESKLLKYEPRFHGSLPVVQQQLEADSVVTLPDTTVYPGRGLILSLALPGMGEWYAGAKTKALFFFGFEVAAWLSWKSFSDKGEAIESKYERFADEHWDLYDWWLRTPWLTSSYGDVVCKGTHHLSLFLPGQTSTISSDSLCGDWIDGVEVVRDHEYYENVGKYDQFVAGWSDLFASDGSNGWWEKEKSVGDSVEIIVMTDLKKDYINQRARANDAYRMATYTVTAIMFNHVVSGLDAFIETRRRKLGTELDTAVGLTFSPFTRSGVGGITFAIRW
tara:strand:- start:16195 stop:17085 length:891 start_codon:yes stop_codon:yes gene_type:complete